MVTPLAITVSKLLLSFLYRKILRYSFVHRRSPYIRFSVPFHFAEAYSLFTQSEWEYEIFHPLPHNCRRGSCWNSISFRKHRRKTVGRIKKSILRTATITPAPYIYQRGPLLSEFASGSGAHAFARDYKETNSRTHISECS